MAGGIFLIQDSGKLVELKEQPYDSENFLQELLAKYPDLIAGDQINSTSPRKWLLIKREKEVPSEEAGSGRWSVDHLFLDQEGIPTLVEVKRSTDTRIRREVIGQMLDYAANGVIYWPVETMRAQFEANCAEGANPDDILKDFLDSDMEVELFWQKVKTNLQAGKVRLIFVADEIPRELRTVVEFLNNQMDPAEVLALELRQYVGQGFKTLVPDVIGQTMQAQQKKNPSAASARQGDEASFYAELEKRQGNEETATARAVLDWATIRGYEIRWTGALSAVASLRHADKVACWFQLDKNGAIYLDFNYMKINETKAFEENVAKRQELFDRLKKFGFRLSDNALAGRGMPSIRLHQLKESKNLEGFKETLEWIVKEVREASTGE